jgi:hypothetical protein
MFFAEGEFERLPKELQKELDKLYLEDRVIYEKNKRKEDVNKEVINFTIGSLKLYLKWHEKVKKDVRDLMSEAVGDIPLTFFVLDELKINKEVERTIDPLLDIIDAHACKWINREELIKNVLKKLQKLKKEEIK